MYIPEEDTLIRDERLLYLGGALRVELKAPCTGLIPC
jgi:hypothetical protein